MFPILHSSKAHDLYFLGGGRPAYSRAFFAFCGENSGRLLYNGRDSSRISSTIVENSYSEWSSAPRRWSSGAFLNMIRTVLVDDHKILQQGLRKLIESSGKAQVVAIANSAEDGLACVKEHRPDIGIFDLGLPDHSGLWLIRQVKTVLPELPILVLSMHSGGEVVASVLRAGANGYLNKSSDEQTLFKAMITVLGGGIYLEPHLADEVKARQGEVASAREALAQSTFNLDLEARELEVLRMTAQGHSNRDIANRLGLSISTVKARLRSTFTKLNVSSRTEAVAAAINLGLMGPVNPGGDPDTRWNSPE